PAVPAPAPPSGDEARTLLEEWKAIGPAPREQADAVWTRFREALSKLRGRREPGSVPREPLLDPSRGLADERASPRGERGERGERFTLPPDAPQFRNTLPLEGIAARLKGVAETTAVPITDATPSFATPPPAALSPATPPAAATPPARTPPARTPPAATSNAA